MHAVLMCMNTQTDVLINVIFFPVLHDFEHTKTQWCVNKVNHLSRVSKEVDGKIKAGPKSLCLSLTHTVNPDLTAGHGRVNASKLPRLTK